MHPDAIRILLPQTCFDGEGDGAGGQRSCSGAGTGIMMPGFGCWSPASFFLPIRRVRGNPSTDRAARRPCAARCLALCLFQFYRILIRLQIINIIIFDRFQQRFCFCPVRSTAATGQGGRYTPGWVSTVVVYPLPSASAGLATASKAACEQGTIFTSVIILTIVSVIEENDSRKQKVSGANKRREVTKL